MLCYNKMNRSRVISVVFLVSEMVTCANSSIIGTLLAPVQNASVETSVVAVVENETLKFRSLSNGFDWSYQSYFMAPCETKDDCREVGYQMICINQETCGCELNHIFIDRIKIGCYPRAQIFASCEFSEQCSIMNHNTYCSPGGTCICAPNYNFDGRECSIRYDSNNLKAQEVYKAAVVAAACFIVAVVGIFVACIVRRSFCRREPHIQQNDGNRNSDIFSISDEIAALRAVDKPPSYEEVLQIERTFYGIPPPEYTASRSVISTTSPNMPTTCASVQTSASTQEYSPLSESFYTSTTSGSTVMGFTSNSDFSDMATSSQNFPQQSIMDQSTFLATAEVLASPQNDTETDACASQNFSSSHYESSTLPSRTHNKIHHIPLQVSSSLPGSPSLKSHQISTFPQTPSSPVSSIFEPSSSSSSSSHTAASCNSTPTHSVGMVEVSLAAYDNPGFVSDAQDAGNSV